MKRLPQTKQTSGQILFSFDKHAPYEPFSIDFRFLSNTFKAQIRRRLRPGKKLIHDSKYSGISFIYLN